MAETDLVTRALAQCEASFISGVHSFHGGHRSDLVIRPNAIQGLRDALRGSFDDSLGEGGRGDWSRDGERMRRIGFYAGALAAFYAYADRSEWVERGHAENAMKHVGTQCKDRLERYKNSDREDLFRAQWVYCPWS